MTDQEKTALWEAEFVPILPVLKKRARTLSLRYKTFEADDLFQETVLLIWRHIDKYEAGTNASRWAFTIMKNFAHNMAKHVIDYSPDDRYQLVFEDNWGREIERDEVPKAKSAEDTYLRGAEMTPVFVDAIDSLVPEYRDVFMLHVYEGLKNQEIAVRLDVHPLTVGTRLFRARNLVRKYLSDVEPEWL